MTDQLMNDSTSRLARSLDGGVTRPGEPGYDDARAVYNAMVDKHPACVVRCASTRDVVRSVGFAREAGLEVAVRCGGHSVTGFSNVDGGVLIDLAGLKQVSVDSHTQVASVGGGTLWGEFDAATQQHALHTPGGRVTTTGVGGFTVGGGYGWTSSKHGLTCDNLISAEVVTADGQVLVASEENNADLFWGLRGGGGNFGIVTRFDFRLHRLGPSVFAGMALWPIERAPEVLSGWREYVEAAPDEVGTGCAVLTAPPEEFVPIHLRGRPVVGIIGTYVGDPEEGARVMRPIKDLRPEVDLFQPMPYTAFQAIVDPVNPPGLRNYFRGEYLDELTDDALEVYIRHAGTIATASPLAQLTIFRLGGGVSAVPDDACVFSHRDAQYLFHPIMLWDDPALDADQIAMARDFADAMALHGTGASYLNFTPDLDRVRQAFGPRKYARLVELKDRYDPDNVFRLNQNIEPTHQVADPTPG